VTEQFHDMRLALRARLDELRVANEALVDRNARLVTLQEDLIQRERFVATGRLVTQLAHEIRNPVAALRNCLEVLRQRLKDDPEGLEFADMAINELLRMHELAEQTLDVGRPKPPTIEICQPVVVAQEVARLVSTGVPSSELGIEVKGNALTTAHVSGDSLKQVLLNLIQNAREACAAASPPVVPAHLTIDIQVDETVRVIVDDNGPGVPASTWKQVFDPFFSTKTAVNGVGLGLFVAQGLLRAVDGRMMVGNSPSGGARFVLEVPQAATAGGRAPLAHA
jgi:two-component system NtrC family sensor kinase